MPGKSIEFASDLRGDQEPASVKMPMPAVRWKTRVGLPLGICTASVGLLAFSARDALTPAVPVRVVPVVAKQISPAETTAAQQKPQAGAASVQAAGWLEAAPYPLLITALADGVVREVAVLEGDRVEVGQVVARLIDDDARIGEQTAAAEVAAREAMLESARASASAAQREWDHPVEMTRRLATADAALAESRANLARWPAELSAEEARVRELAADYERVQKLAASNQSSEIELIRAREKLAAQTATTEATRLREPVLEALLAGYEAEAIAACENLKLRIPETRAVDESRAAVANATAMLARARAALEEARLRVSRMEVRSPVAGIVMARAVHPGSKLTLASDNAGSAEVMRIYDPAKLQVRVDVPLADAGGIGVGQEAEIVVGILPNQTFRGRVTRIAHEADVARNTLQCKVAIENPSEMLRPEMLARVRFLSAGGAASQPGGGSGLRIFAPTSAVRRGDDGKIHTWVVDVPRSAAQRREITLGAAREPGWTEVVSGLRPADRLIVDPVAKLADGRRIRVVEEALGGAGGADGVH